MKLLEIQISDSLAGRRLDEGVVYILKQSGFELSKSKAKALIEKGSVYLNKKRIRIASKPLFRNAWVGVYWKNDLSLQNPKPSLEWDLKQNILYEDDVLVAVSKPCGLPTHATLDDAREHLYGWVQKRGGYPYLGLHHRLDVQTSGVVLFSKSKSVNAALSELFQKRQIEKTYLCGVSKKPECLENLKTEMPEIPLTPGFTWQLRQRLSPVPKQKATDSRQRFEVSPHGKIADTRFTFLEELNEHWLLQASPKTGRTHQIRVQLAQMGLPILGDRLYGGAPCARMLLHAQKILFQHPLTRIPLLIESPLPSDFMKFIKDPPLDLGRRRD